MVDAHRVRRDGMRWTVVKPTYTSCNSQFTSSYIAKFGTMGNATSSSSSPKITPHDKAILQLKLQRDKLQKSKQKIQTVIRRENQLAKQCVIAKNFEKAKLTLRKKKRQQSLLDTLERQSNTLEELIDTIEFKLIEKDVLYGLEQGNKVLKEINGEMSIEKVDKIMEETAEAVEYQNELSERLGTLLTNSEELEVDEELRALELEMGVAVEESIQKVPATSVGDAVVKDKLGNLPSAPSGIQKERNVEDEENETSAVHQENERVALPA